MSYNLQKFDMIFNDILKKGKPSSYDLSLIKNELNKFYQGDSQCSEIFYTVNLDKPFFGMKVYPNITDNQIINTFTPINDKNYTPETYILEFDSKLFDQLNGFDAREITAILMHEIGHLVCNSKVNKEIIQNSINHYQAKSRSNINIESVAPCIELFKYAYIYTIESIQSIFKKDTEEFEADRFSVEMGYGPDLESAFTKILKLRGTIRPEGKLNTLIWSLTVYKQLFLRKKFILKCMDELNQYSGSKLDKQANLRLKESLFKSFKKPIFESYLVQDRLDYINESVFGNMKRSGMKAIEDDTYVYQIRIKNVDNEYEAMDIMRDINSKINIVSDYLNNEKNLSDSEKKRWTVLLSKLESLRDELVSSDSYKKTTYGLWIKLPVTERRY